ncbi:MAG: hypothetical protein IKN37_00740, partial [Bacteroidales bacterium]|nr:hypothetical protein [Bacteroidales bacterium]
MELTERLSGYKSCAVIGMEKNTGKTECLNHILAHYPSGRVIAVTSIGVDGERSDRVTETPKPEIFLREGVIFSTSETHYRQRRLDAEILGFSNEGTSLGRIVIARTRCPGKVMLSGPSTANGLRRSTLAIASARIDDQYRVAGLHQRVLKTLAPPVQYPLTCRTAVVHDD